MSGSAAAAARAIFDAGEANRTAADRADQARVEALHSTLGEPDTTLELFHIATRMYDRQSHRMRQLRSVWEAMDAETPTNR